MTLWRAGCVGTKDLESRGYAVAGCRGEQACATLSGRMTWGMRWGSDQPSPSFPRAVRAIANSGVHQWTVVVGGPGICRRFGVTQASCPIQRTVSGETSFWERSWHARNSTGGRARWTSGVDEQSLMVAPDSRNFRVRSKSPLSLPSPPPLPVAPPVSRRWGALGRDGEVGACRRCCASFPNPSTI